MGGFTYGDGVGQHVQHPLSVSMSSDLKRFDCLSLFAFGQFNNNDCPRREVWENGESYGTVQATKSFTFHLTQNAQQFCLKIKRKKLKQSVQTSQRSDDDLFVDQLPFCFPSSPTLKC